MPLFELDETGSRLVRPMQPAATSFGPESSALVTEHLSELLGEGLLPVAVRRSADDDQPHMLALDVVGQPVVVEVVAELDAEALIKALNYAGEAGRLTSGDLAELYHAGAEQFGVDLVGFRDSLPAAYSRRGLRVGARLLLVCSTVHPEIADALEFLRAPGRQVEVLQMGVIHGAGGRRFLDVSPLAGPIAEMRQVEQANLRLVRSKDAFAAAMAYDEQRRSAVRYAAAPDGAASARSPFAAPGASTRSPYPATGIDGGAGARTSGSAGSQLTPAAGTPVPAVSPVVSPVTPSVRSAGLPGAAPGRSQPVSSPGREPVPTRGDFPGDQPGVPRSQPASAGVPPSQPASAGGHAPTAQPGVPSTQPTTPTAGLPSPAAGESALVMPGSAPASHRNGSSPPRTSAFARTDAAGSSEGAARGEQYTPVFVPAPGGPLIPPDARPLTEEDELAEPASPTAPAPAPPAATHQASRGTSAPTSDPLRPPGPQGTAPTVPSASAPPAATPPLAPSTGAHPLGLHGTTAHRSAPGAGPAKTQRPDDRLVAIGAAEGPLELVWLRERRGQRLTATLRPDGLIELSSGEVFGNPDAAAQNAARAALSVDGWGVWRIGDGGPTLRQAVADA